MHPPDRPRLSFFIACLLLALAAPILGITAPVASVGAQETANVRVLAYHHENNFPNDLTISITAESGNEIVEVQAHYRPQGSRVWAYGYADFTPGQRVSARFRIATSGTGYTPPGAEIEYYFTLRDAGGGTFETPALLAEYWDHRFQWEPVQIGPLTLYYHDLPQSRAQTLVRDLEGDIRRLEEMLQLEVREPVRGFIYNGYAEASTAFPQQSRTITQREVFHGFAFPAYQVFLGIGLQPRIIGHEAAHLMLAQALGPGRSNLPAWLDEGFASYVEPGSNPYSGRSLSSRGPSLRAMASVSGTPSDITHFYRKSESVVAFLMDEYGVEAFQGLLNELRRGRLIDAALVNIYGFDTDGLEARWAESPAGRSVGGFPAPVNILAQINAWFLGVLVLAVVTVVFIRYLYRKLYGPAEDPEERLQPWEDPDLEDDRRY
jgi:hypothetical protein